MSDPSETNATIVFNRYVISYHMGMDGQTLQIEAPLGLNEKELKTLTKVFDDLCKAHEDRARAHCTGDDPEDSGDYSHPASPSLPGPEVG
jgi:hypothetical protein